MATPRRSRAQARADMEAAILRAGRDQLAERGAAALSLREIARSLDVVSSAVYRYVESRDALLTLLLVDAYDDLADHVDAAMESAPADPAAHLRALAGTMRSWALAHPERWGLVYGAPVPGYAAPEATRAPGTRVMARLVAVAAQGDPPGPAPQGAWGAYLQAGIADLGTATTTRHGAAAVHAWCTLVGTISMEVFGQLGPEVDAEVGAQLLAETVDGLVTRLALPHP